MKQKLKMIGIIAGLSLSMLLFWGLIEPYHLKVTNEDAVIPNLPESWDRKEIAVIGDLQVGMWMDNTSTIRDAVSRLVEEEPTAVLIVGDFVYHPIDQAGDKMKEVTKMLRPLEDSNIPVYAVLGNHDYMLDNSDGSPNREYAEQVASELEDAGINIMNNETIPLAISKHGVQESNKPKESLFLAGVAPTWVGNAEPKEILEQIPSESARFIMMHNPESFKEMDEGTAPVAVAGHTHGGQVRIPIISDWFYNSILNKKHVMLKGWVESLGKDNNNLYVNPGIGFSGAPLRINCPPEITIFTLKSDR